jgi:hypothetical protein
VGDHVFPQSAHNSSSSLISTFVGNATFLTIGMTTIVPVRLAVCISAQDGFVAPPKLDVGYLV